MLRHILFSLSLRKDVVCCRVQNTTVWLQECIGEGFGSGWGESKERVWVDYEGGFGLVVEVQNWCKDRFVVAMTKHDSAGRI